MKTLAHAVAIALVISSSSLVPGAELNVPLNVSAVSGFFAELHVEDGETIPILLQLTYDLKGRLVSDGFSTVGRTDVGVKGKVTYKNGVETYKLALKGAGVSVKITGEIGSPTASVKYKGPEGKAVEPTQEVSLTVAAIDARIELFPEVDARGRILGDGTIRGYAEVIPMPLRGKFSKERISWSLKFGSQKVSFKGTREADDASYLGIAKVRVPPAKMTISDFRAPIADFVVPFARTLRDQGLTATEAAIALEDEFAVGADVITRVLIDAGFDAVDIARALTSVYSASAAEVALVLRDTETTEAVLSALSELGYGVPEVVDVLDEVYGITESIRIEELLIAARFQIEDILAITQIEVIQDLAPVVHFAGDPQAGFPMSAQRFFDEMLCGQAGGPDSVTTLTRGRADASAGPADGLSEIRFDAGLPQDAGLEAGDKVELKNFAAGIDGVYEIASIEAASGTLVVKDPGERIRDLTGDGDERLLRDAQEEDVAGTIRDECAQRDPATGEFVLPYQNADPSTLEHGEVPTYFSVTTVSPDGLPIEAGLGQLRIRYWWYYGHQPACLSGLTIAEVNEALDQIDNVIEGINSVSDAIDFLDIIPDIPSTGLGHQVDATNKGEHIADWEHIDIYTDEARTEVLAVKYSQHTGAYTKLRR